LLLKRERNMKRLLMKLSKNLQILIVSISLTIAAKAYMIFNGDGSDEPGFVSPHLGPPPPPPPSHIASAETSVPYPGPPGAPQARSEKKNPPNPPVLFCKIKTPWTEDWAARPNDVNNLLKTMKKMLNVNFSMETKSMSEININPEKNPILYRTGCFHFKYTDLERKLLRQYLLNGGMIIYDAGMGSKPFYDSAKEELAAIFPEIALQRLSEDHPIFHSYYDLDQVQYRNGVKKAGYKNDSPWLEGITVNCRTVAVVSRWGLSVGWDVVNDESLRAFSIDSAQKLGINLVSYATAERAWAKQFVNTIEFVDKEQNSSGKIKIVQIIYDGEWLTRHKGLSVLMEQFNKKTDIPVKFLKDNLRLTDARIFDNPVLYITGHENFSLSNTEINSLRKYLQNGGILFAEACCGRKAFDVAFKREMSKVLPGTNFKKVNSGTLLNIPNKLSEVGLTPALAAQSGNHSMIIPDIETIFIKEHCAVIYSPYGLSGGWEMSPNPYGFSYDEIASLNIGENILLYTATQ
jgi:hypothetical protein